MDHTIVQTRYGRVMGEQAGNVGIWRGIPFARAPMGPLRFRPPQEPEAWEGVRAATSFAPSAMQAELPLFGVGETSEDCLYLNIWSPHADQSRRPVMVWIHGGAFAIGSGSQALYDGASFAGQGDMVVVTINYRLGAFGYLYLGALGGEEYACSGNCGLLDQIAALKWVQENIEAFGGDPQRVTVAGESAGAVSIGNLLAMPAARGLFHRAILESTAAPAISLDRAARVADQLLASLEIQPPDFRRLWEIPARDLVTVTKDFPWGSFWPVVDGITIPQPPEEAIREGAARDIPVLIGSNKEEYQLFAVLDPSYAEWDEAEISRRLVNVFGTLWPEISRRFPGEHIDKPLFIRIMSYHVLVYPTLKYSEMLSGHAPAWVYQFSFAHPMMGASHAMELPFVWNNLNQMPMLSIDSPEVRGLADRMHQAWIAFIRGGDPNIPGLPEWPCFDLKDRAVMVFDGESGVQKDPHPDRVVWDEIASLPGYQPTTAREIDLAGNTRFITEPAREAPGTLELRCREGYFSVRDKIGDILKNRQGAQLITSMYEKFGEGSGARLNKMMIKMVQNLSLEELAAMAGKRFPEGALYEINEALIRIKK